MNPVAKIRTIFSRFDHKSSIKALKKSWKCLESGSGNLVRSFSSLEALNETLIVTKSCANRIKELQDKTGNTELRLRVAVEGGGCSGFQYNFSMDSDMHEDEDLIFEKNGMQVVVDEGSFELIKGSTVDFERELIRSAFAITGNPQSDSACGCGSSFALKNFALNPALD